VTGPVRSEESDDISVNSATDTDNGATDEQ
jgi:hypothetical protein